jgi:hypothetical protein
MEVAHAIIIVLTANHATMAIAQLTATWVNGVIGARAPKAVAMVFNPVVAIL